jgi:hypothetical protein
MLALPPPFIDPGKLAGVTNAPAHCWRYVEVLLLTTILNESTHLGKERNPYDRSGLAVLPAKDP